jgi:hypothetical protein
MKKIAVFMMVLLLVSSFASMSVLADNAIRPDRVVLVPGSSEAGNSGTQFAFIQGVSDTGERKAYYYDGKNSFPDYVGEECLTGEYIVPFRSSSRFFSSNHRVFTDDYLKSSRTDLLPIYRWKTASWFLEGEEALPYDGYICKHAGAQLQEPEGANGKFVSALSFPSKVRAGERFTISGRYFVSSPGEFVLEAYVDPTSGTPLTVVRSSESSCDGSYFWAGSKIPGVAGQYYDFYFTVKAPANPGKYDLQVHAWTDCWKDGGEEINKVRGQIEVAGEECSPLNVAGNIGRSLKAAGQLLWNRDSSSFRNVVESSACSLAQIDSYCGTRDSDGDGIPDNCDYCRLDKGVPQDNNGCHPCFGMNPYSDDGKYCYELWKDRFPPPERVYDVVNPIVDRQKSCEGNTLRTFAVRDWGDIEPSDSQDCGSKECVEDGNNAFCQNVAAPVTPTGAETVCEGSRVIEVTSFSDGTTQRSELESCPDGCAGGECLVPTSGGTPTIIDNSQKYGINPEGPADSGCREDGDCAGGEICSLGICEDTKNEYCDEGDVNSCPSGQECLGGFCVDEGSDGCTDNADCAEGLECFDTYCVPELTYDDSDPTVPCTEDIIIDCDEGSVVTEVCVNEELIPTGENCVDDGSYTGSGSSPSSPSSYVGSIPGIEKVSFLQGSDGQVDNNRVFTYLAVLILVIGAGYFIYVKQFKKTKGKRRKKK